MPWTTSRTRMVTKSHPRNQSYQHRPRLLEVVRGRDYSHPARACTRRGRGRRSLSPDRTCWDFGNRRGSRRFLAACTRCRRRPSQWRGAARSSRESHRRQVDQRLTAESPALTVTRCEADAGSARVIENVDRRRAWALMSPSRALLRSCRTRGRSILRHVRAAPRGRSRATSCRRPSVRAGTSA